MIEAASSSEARVVRAPVLAKGQVGSFALMAALLWRSRLTLVVAAVMGMLGGVAGASLIAVIHRVQQGGRLVFGSWTLAVFIAVLVLRLLAGFVSKLLLVRTGQEVVRHLRTLLARRFLSASLVSLEVLGAHRVTAMLTSDVAAVALCFANIPTLCVNGTMVAGCLVYLGWLSPPLLVMTLAVILVGVGIHRVLSRRATHWLSRARQTENALFGHLSAMTDGFKELKMDSGQRSRFLSELLDVSAEEYRRNNVGGYSAYAVAEAWSGFLVFLPLGIVLFSEPFATSGSALSSAYVLIILFLVAPLASVVGLLPMIGSALVSMRSIESLRARLDETERRAERGPPLIRAGAWRCLSFEGVGFSYRGEAGFEVGPVHFTVRPGEIVFVVGGNGSGKSTFVKLLSGLYTPRHGRICIDGVPVHEELGQRYRDSLSVIFSDSHLFPELPVVTDEEGERRARSYLELLRIQHVVQIRDGRFSRADLSTGQKKRLAMVGALLKERPILVLDEWTAEQDADSRAFFYDELLPALRKQGTAVIAVTHDERFFASADRLVRFDYGRNTEERRTDAA